MGEFSFKIGLHQIKPSDVIGSDDVDYIKVMAFDEQGRILVLITENGLGLPCSRVDFNDRDAFDAAHREAWETANITLGKLAVLNKIEMTAPDGVVRQTLLLSAQIARTDPMRSSSYIRLFLEPDLFLKYYSDEIETLQEHLEMARRVLPEFHLEKTKKASLCLRKAGGA